MFDFLLFFALDTELGRKLFMEHKFLMLFKQRKMNFWKKTQNNPNF